MEEKQNLEGTVPEKSQVYSVHLQNPVLYKCNHIEIMTCARSIYICLGLLMGYEYYLGRNEKPALGSVKSTVQHCGLRRNPPKMQGKLLPKIQLLRLQWKKMSKEKNRSFLGDLMKKKVTVFLFERCFRKGIFKLSVTVCVLKTQDRV